MSENRRDFLFRTGASVLGAHALARAAAGPSRPHIVMVFSNDITLRDFGCYGNRNVRTPNLDQVAAEGTCFTNMFTPAPHCAPSRAALYTGLYPFRNGAHPNHSEVKPGIKSMAHYMKAAGYRPIVTGVTHIKPWKESFPFETLAYGNKELEPILANPGDKPLCLIMCEWGAHDMWPGGNRHSYDVTKVDIPPYHVDTPETRFHRARYYSAITETDQQVGKLLDLLKKHRLDENTLFIFASDHGTGWPHEKLMLYDASLNLPFIVRWPGKIKPGTKTTALCSVVDILPTFIEAAGGDVSRVVSECGGEELDGESFLPVLLGQKHEHRSEVFGSFTWDVTVAYPMRAIRTTTHKYIWNIDSQFEYPSDWWQDIPYQAQKFAVGQSWSKKAETDAHAAAMIRAERFRPAEELYDIRNDPHEMKNLADDPAHRPVLESLRGKLKAWMKQQGDAGDSAYHKEVASGKRRHLDKVFCRRPVISLRMAAVDPVGRWTDKVKVTLSTPVWRAEIRYTLDGSEPTRNSSLYAEPFLIPGPPVIIKARGFWQGGETPVKVVEYAGIDCNFLYHNDHWEPRSF